jgi:hypothetical protein
VHLGEAEIAIVESLRAPPYGKASHARTHAQIAHGGSYVSAPLAANVADGDAGQEATGVHVPGVDVDVEQV